MSWNTLTERQKQLDRAIEGCNVSLDSSESCLNRVMESIGANMDEKDFVRERITMRLRTQQVLKETDDLIDRTSRMLDFFEEDDKKWEL